MKSDVPLINQLFSPYTNLVFVVIEESSSLQDTIFCFGISPLAKILLFERWRSWFIIVCRYNFRILQVHKDRPCIGKISNQPKLLICRRIEHLQSTHLCCVLQYRVSQSIYNPIANSSTNINVFVLIAFIIIATNY